MGHDILPKEFSFNRQNHWESFCNKNFHFLRILIFSIKHLIWHNWLIKTINSFTAISEHPSSKSYKTFIFPNSQSKLLLRNMVTLWLETIFVCDKINCIRLTIGSYPRNLSTNDKGFEFCACIFNFSFFTSTDAVACFISFKLKISH